MNLESLPCIRYQFMVLARDSGALVQSSKACVPVKSTSRIKRPAYLHKDTWTCSVVKRIYGNQKNRMLCQKSTDKLNVGDASINKPFTIYMVTEMNMEDTPKLLSQTIMKAPKVTVLKYQGAIRSSFIYIP